MNRITTALVFAACAGCSGAAVSPTLDTVCGPASDDSRAGSVATTTYSGFVLADSRTGLGNVGGTVDAWFGKGVAPGVVASCQPTVGSCCAGAQLISDPDPNAPGAGRIVVDRQGSLLATLTFSTETGGSFGSYRTPGFATWSPGDVLNVCAAGGEVSGFSGSLRTPARISGVSPALDGAPITIVRGRDLQVSWSPEGKEGEQMWLQVAQSSSGSSGLGAIISCVVADSAGSVIVDGRLLSSLMPAASSSAGAAGVSLSRVLTSTVSNGNVTVSLAGASGILEASASVQ